MCLPELFHFLPNNRQARQGWVQDFKSGDTRYINISPFHLDSSWSLAVHSKWLVQEAFMEERSQFEALRRDQETLRFQFISTELDLALTFVNLSQLTDDVERSERNLNHAHKAVEAAKKYLRGTNLSTAERKDLVEKLHKLERLLASDPPQSRSE